MKNEYFFKRVESPKNTNELALCAAVDPLLYFHFPLQNLSKNAIKSLENNVFLTDEHNALRRNMLRELPISEDFIHQIVAMHVIEKNVVDYRDTKVNSLTKFEHMPQCEFVSAPGFENLFFVMDIDMTNLSLICVELHQNKPLVYRRVALDIKQVSPANWQGNTYELEDYAALFSIEDENTFLQKICEIEVCDIDNNDKCQF